MPKSEDFMLYCFLRKGIRPWRNYLRALLEAVRFGRRAWLQIGNVSNPDQGKLWTATPRPGIFDWAFIMYEAGG